MVENLSNNLQSKQIKDGDLRASNHNHIELNMVQNRLKIFKSTVLQDVEKRMSSMIEDVMQEIRQHELQQNEFQSFANSNTHPKAKQSHLSTWCNRVRVNSSSANDDDKAPTDKRLGEDEETVTAQQRSERLIKNLMDHQTTDDQKKNQNQKQIKERNQTKRLLADKVYVTRESYLTALLKVDHMKSIYHIFYIIFLIIMLNGVCHDFFVEGKINFGLGTFKTGLAKIHYVFSIWSVEHLFVFLLYYAFKGWAIIRRKLAAQASLQRFWSHCCLITYICSQLVFGYVASALCIKLDLPFVTASVLLLESTRLLMKMHAFVRTNTPRVLAGKLKADDNDNENEKCTKIDGKLPVPTFGCYLYFLFAPTLVYRDSYPRTTQIRWKFALSRLMEVVAIAFLYSYIHERYIRVNYANYGLEEMNASILIVKIFGMLMPCVIIFLCGFYLILHAWLNFTGELLRFGDRMFYKDWWTAWTYDGYYRNWNVVVHDWLYEYIYKDTYNKVFKNSKLAAALTVFMVSALVHEHILAFALQMFFPVMFFFFGIVGVSLVFITRRAPKIFGNLLLWFSLIIGNGLLISLYCIEYYANQNCPKTYTNWTDYFIPAMWSCYRR